jgi:hypothetical protein
LERAHTQRSFGKVIEPLILENLGFRYNRLSNVHNPLQIVDELVYFEVYYHFGAQKTCVEICVEKPHQATVGQYFFFNSTSEALRWVANTFQVSIANFLY